MHILIVFLTALTGLFYALDRLGVDIGWLNPWAWRRRRRWLKQLHTNPAFNLDSPMEAVALLLVATGRVEGDLSFEEKAEIKSVFIDVFKQSETDAAALLASSTYLLGSGDDVFKRPENVLARSLEHFSDEQKQSTIELMQRVASVGSEAGASQADFIARASGALKLMNNKVGWQ
ncbi:MAG: hypothetical protein ACK5ME_04295 [Parahaliea sp.]